ncbi:MAG TPA: ATP-binding protein [Verrucomicrobiae bacterium]|nr:ATP-binding protein [Verrucomicrobiae bacterium]
MARHFPTQKSTFLWQAILIVLPVLLLAVVGFFSLRQDKLLAQHEAAERAQGLADNLAPVIWSDLTAKGDKFDSRAFKVDSAGRLVYPPPYPPIPTAQNFKSTGLNLEQVRLWQAAQQAEAGAGDPARAIALFRELLKSEPPKGIVARVNFSLGLLLQKQGKTKEAAGIFQLLVDKFPEALGESGLPLQPLARLKLMELSTLRPQAAAGDPLLLLNALCSNAIEHPNALTPQILSRAMELARTPQAQERAFKWQELWAEQEMARFLYSAAKKYLQTAQPGVVLMSESPANPAQASPAVEGETSPSVAPPQLPQMFWFEPSPDSSKPAPVPETRIESWLAARCEGDATNCYVCRSESEIGSRLRSFLQEKWQVPDYFGIAIEVAGKRVRNSAPDLRMWHRTHYMGGKGAGQEGIELLGQVATNILASAAGPDRAGPLKVLVYLTSPQTLYERQSARTFWFGSLIAASAMVALVGLLAAYRAFSRQLRLSELKSNFVSSVSHELRAPIASVRLLAESLERGKVSEPSKQHQYFGFIAQECRRLSALVENVLDFSRIEQGRKQYEFEPTNVAALVEQTVRLMETYAAEKQVHLSLSLPQPVEPTPGSPPPALDGKAIQQALVNLIDNALKHSPKEGNVRVGMEQAAPQSQEPIARPSDPAVRTPVSTISIWVEDDGEGIPAAEHGRIFERFYRCGSELRRETQGVGIGLSIVKHIVEAHGGQVLVRSAPGQGSRFTIELPIWNGY